MKNLINEVKKMQSMAGILKEYELGDEDPRDPDEIDPEVRYEDFLNKLAKIIVTNVDRLSRNLELDVDYEKALEDILKYKYINEV